MIAQYKQAPEFRELRESTRYNYMKALDRLSESYGTHPIVSFDRKHILKLRDNYADTPAKANTIVSVLRIVMTFAVDRDFRKDNPAGDVKTLATGPGHATWPDDAINHFLASARPNMCLALKLGLYTSQRKGDVLAMSWSAYDGTYIDVVQSKTGAKLSIPVHHVLKDALNSQERVSPIILTTEAGRPCESSYFNKCFLAAMRDAGLSGLVFHGLRYTAAAKLAEAGCSMREIAAITGHKSTRMLEKYTRGADQKRLAGAAILRLENANGTRIGKPG